MTIGLFIVRATIGMALVLQGAAKVTRDGRQRAGDYFESVGFRPGPAMAVTAGLTELGAGLLLVSGLASTLAVAGAFGIVLCAAIVSWADGYWNANGGAEYPIVMGLAVLGLAFTGPGQFSVDELLGWAEPTTGAALASIALGLAAAVPLLARRALHRRSMAITPTAIAEAG